MKKVKFKDLKAGEFFTFPGLLRDSWDAHVYMKLNEEFVNCEHVEKDNPSYHTPALNYKYVDVGIDMKDFDGYWSGWHDSKDLYNDYSGMLKSEISDNTKVIPLKATFEIVEYFNVKMKTRYCPVGDRR